LTIGSQAIDALRTGRLLGRFPNVWPVDADRHAEPITFWSAVVMYFAAGLLFVGFGVAMIAGWVAA
jgi:hypothetical protein